MPRYSIVLIRTAFLWLAVGSTVGGLMLINKGVPFWPSLWAWRWAHVHMLLVGWTLQLACGVASWILPRKAVSGWRGDIRLIWLCYFALNGGVLAAAAPGTSALLGFDIYLDGLYLVSGVLYAIAATLWVIHAWPRIVPSLLQAQPPRPAGKNSGR